MESPNLPEELPPTTEQEGTGGFSEQDFSSLLESIGSMAPLLQAFSGSTGAFPNAKKGGDGEKNREHCGKSAQRTALIRALMPYLSPERCRRAEAALKLAAIADVLHTFPSHS